MAVVHLGNCGIATYLGGNSDESDYEQFSTPEESDGDSDEDFDAEGGRKGSKMKSDGKIATTGRPVLPPLLSKAGGTLLVYGLNPRQRRTFYNNVLRFGMPPVDNTLLTQWCPRELKLKTVEELRAYATLFLRHACEPTSGKDDLFSDGIPKESFARQLVLSRIGTMKIIRNKIDQYKEINGSHWLHCAPPEYLQSFSEDDLKVLLTKCSVSKEKPQPSVPVVVDEKIMSDDHKECTSEIVNGVKVTFNVDDVVGDGEPGEKMEEVEDVKDVDVPVKVESTGLGFDPCKFMFNISDGGFTELHSLWHMDKDKPFDPSHWSRRHDYWLLRGIVQHGYLRWTDICGDSRFDIINRPFVSEGGDSIAAEGKQKFLMRRLKLLEQALVVEEQLHRAASLGLQHDPKLGIMQLHSRFTELDCLVDGHKHLLTNVKKGERSAVMLLKRALTKMDDLLNEMKSDLSKLPFQLAKIDSVTNQLQMTEVSILSRMASHFSVEHKQKQSQSAAVVSIDPEVMGEASSFTSAN
jgi:hypothetical protein